ncbi:hypothetical protein Tco_0870233 [Tanacetum coccineum]
MAVVEVPQTLEYRGGQLNAAPILEVENFTNWKKRFMCHIIGIKPQFENIISNGPYIPMATGQRKPETQSTLEERKAANLDQRLKSLIMSMLLALMNEFVNDGIKLSKLEINTGFIKGLPKKWIAFCQSLRNTNHVKESELPSLFGKLKYEENLINNIYDTNKEKTLVPETPLSTAFFSISIDEEEVSSDDNELTEVKALMALADEERVFVGKENSRNDNVSITDSNKPRLSEAKNSTLSNHDTVKIPSVESQKNTTDPSIVVTESLSTNYDSADKSSVCSTPLSPLKKLDGAKPALVGKLRNVKMEDDHPLAIVMKELNELKLQISKNKKSEALQAKKVKSFKASKTESSSALRSKTPTKRSLNSYPLQMEDTLAHW